MKCMVSYIQWYHQKFDSNGRYLSLSIVSSFIYHFSETSRLLRTGASMGNPYLYIKKVRVIKGYSVNKHGYTLSSRYSCKAAYCEFKTTVLF